MDTEYLKTHLGSCLGECVSEVALKRPHDPIEFMAQWLYKHIENKTYGKQMQDDAVTLVKEKEEFEKEQERQEKLRIEKQRIAQEEQERKKDAPAEEGETQETQE